jgi:hypothetical protein
MHLSSSSCMLHLSAGCNEIIGAFLKQIDMLHVGLSKECRCCGCFTRGKLLQYLRFHRKFKNLRLKLLKF